MRKLLTRRRISSGIAVGEALSPLPLACWKERSLFALDQILTPVSGLSV